MKNIQKSPAEIRNAVLQALHLIAPEADLPQLSAEVSLREELDIDSVDFLRFIVLLHQELGIDIPEADYAELTTLTRCVAYLDSKINRPDT